MQRPRGMQERMTHSRNPKKSRVAGERGHAEAQQTGQKGRGQITGALDSTWKALDSSWTRFRRTCHLQIVFFLESLFRWQHKQRLE